MLRAFDELGELLLIAAVSKLLWEAHFLYNPDLEELLAVAATSSVRLFLGILIIFSIYYNKSGNRSI